MEKDPKISVYGDTSVVVLIHPSNGVEVSFSFGEEGRMSGEVGCMSAGVLVVGIVSHPY